MTFHSLDVSFHKTSVNEFHPFWISALAASSLQLPHGHPLKLNRAAPGLCTDGRPHGKPTGGAKTAFCMGPNAPV